MGKPNLKTHWPLLLSLTTWLGIDLITKKWASFANLEDWVFVEDVFYFTLHHNEGVAFGITFGQWPQVALSMVILGILASYSIQKEAGDGRNGFLKRILLGIIMGGAIGNLVNRIWLGAVVDFIYLRPFPIFNLADIGITLGLLALFLLTFRKTP